MARLDQHPIFVCINNDAVGRSAHYGLSAADLVYEYVVEGFVITRLTAMYQSQDSERIGPVRSARLLNIWMTYMYDGILACAGGGDHVRYILKHEVGFPYLDSDIDDPSNTVYFQSLGNDYRTRMQASTAGVRRWMNDMAEKCLANPQLAYCQQVIRHKLTDDGTLKPWDRPGFEFSKTPPDFEAGTASVIQIPYSGGNHVEWRYDPAQNVYMRYQGGQPHIDNTTGRQISAANVIILATQHELTDLVVDVLGTKGVDIMMLGFGDLRIFRDGRIYEGTWRANEQSPPRWIGPGEQVIPLQPGQSWIQVVQAIEDVTYH